jgi:hypothetical protein
MQGVGQLGFEWVGGLETMGLRSGVKMGTHPLCPGEDSITHILLNCHGERKKERKKGGRNKYLGMKWLQMSEVVAVTKLTRCSKTTDLRQ